MLACLWLHQRQELTRPQSLERAPCRTLAQMQPQTWMCLLQRRVLMPAQNLWRALLQSLWQALLQRLCLQSQRLTRVPRQRLALKMLQTRQTLVPSPLQN